LEINSFTLKLVNIILKNKYMPEEAIHALS
jgi:hypothetical protein